LQILDAIKGSKTFPYQLAQGWFAIKNLKPNERDLSNEQRDQQETEFFSGQEWQALRRPNRLGIDNLKTALVKMHSDQ